MPCAIEWDMIFNKALSRKEKKENFSRSTDEIFKEEYNFSNG